MPPPARRVNRVDEVIESTLVWGNPVKKLMPVSELDVQDVPEDNPERIPKATLDEWCDYISTPSQQVRARDLETIFNNVFMSRMATVKPQRVTFAQMVKSTAEIYGRDVYVTAFWLVCGDVQEKYLVEIVREGCALLQHTNSSDKREIFTMIGGYVRDVEAEHMRVARERMMFKLQLEEDLRRI